MEKEFIPYEQALALKELGFDEPCFGLFIRDKSLLVKEMPNQNECEIYFGGILAPTFSQAFRWFREKLTFRHHISIYIKWDKTDYTYEWVIENLYNIPYTQNGFDTYEEAEQACLDKLIEIVKQ